MEEKQHVPAEGQGILGLSGRVKSPQAPPRTDSTAPHSIVLRQVTIPFVSVSCLWTQSPSTRALACETGLPCALHCDPEPEGLLGTGPPVVEGIGRGMRGSGGGGLGVCHAPGLCAPRPVIPRGARGPGRGGGGGTARGQDCP